jgi:hypothetical protein
LRAKFTPNLFFHFRSIQKRMSRLVCIEESRDRHELAQTFDERAFTRGNSAGDSDRRHKKLSAVELCQPQISKNKRRHANVTPRWLVAAIDLNRHQAVQ